MKVYAVRVAGFLEPVGIYFAHDECGLWNLIDELTDPDGCECKPIKVEGGVQWDGSTDAQWAEIDEDDEECNPERECTPGLTEELFGKVYSGKGWRRIKYSQVQWTEDFCMALESSVAEPYNAETGPYDDIVMW